MSLNSEFDCEENIGSRSVGEAPEEAEEKPKNRDQRDEKRWDVRMTHFPPSHATSEAPMISEQSTPDPPTQPPQELGRK